MPTTGHYVAGNDYWDSVKLIISALAGGGLGGGLVRALGQNRNEATANTLRLVDELQEGYQEQARRIDAMQALAVQQAQNSGENRARLDYMESRAMLQDQRIDQLADQVTIGALLRERLLKEMAVLQAEMVRVEAELVRVTVERDELKQRVTHLEAEIAELRTSQGAEIATNTAAVNEATAATQNQTDATRENTAAQARANTEARRDT